MPRVSKVENGRSINDIVDKLNELDGKWQDIRSPVMDFKEKCLKAAKLDKTDGAAIQHAFLGLLVTIPAVVKGITADSLKNMVKINIEKEPHLTIVGSVADLADVVEFLSEWISGYVKALLAVPEVQTSIEGIPDEVQKVSSGVKDEFSDLDVFGLAKMTKSVLKCVSTIKDTCEEIINEMKELVGEFDSLKGAFTDVQAAIEDGTIVDKGLAAASAGKSSILDCYNNAYPDKPIVAPTKAKKSGGGDGQGCCIIM